MGTPKSGARHWPAPYPPAAIGYDKATRLLQRLVANAVVQRWMTPSAVQPPRPSGARVAMGIAAAERHARHRGTRTANRSDIQQPRVHLGRSAALFPVPRPCDHMPPRWLPAPSAGSMAGGPGAVRARRRW